MGLLRGIGYFFAILTLLAGLVLFPIGIPLVIGAIVWMWFLHKGGQVTSMKKDLERIRKIQQIQQETKDIRTRLDKEIIN